MPFCANLELNDDNDPRGSIYGTGTRSISEIKQGIPFGLGASAVAMVRLIFNGALTDSKVTPSDITLPTRSNDLCA